MTDKSFERLMQKAAGMYNKYKLLLEEAEREYERRFGDNPSNVDDDSWIDAMHGACGMCSGLTVDEVRKGAELAGLHDKMTRQNPKP
jgi:hypothetical protein